ncbi:MAG TPA: hypothetical protein VG755_32355 [Nannocystaceae bacterium]|nr:hypothetical protein [Nannocystaceae bacterium]
MKWIAPLFLVGCVPDVDVDLALVDAPRVLALAAMPAEVEPGAEVTMTALFVDGDGAIAAGPQRWAFCRARRPLAELGPIARACLDEGDERVVALGSGPSIAATVPDDACRLFGPDPPEALAPGEPAGRPVDPDVTGGYYQPVVVLDDAAIDPGLLQLRIDCGVASATQAQAAELRRRHQANLAPAVVELDAPTEVEAGDRVELRVRWTDCPDEEQSCAGAETYAYFDPIALEIATARESIGIAWYATAGSFDDARTGRARDEPEAYGDNVWTAPDRAGPVTLWIVLRDDRGGASWHEQTITVR